MRTHGRGLTVENLFRNDCSCKNAIWHIPVYAENDSLVLTRMTEATSLTYAYQVITDRYNPNTIVKKHRVAKEIGAVRTIEGENLVGYYGRKKQSLQKLTMLGNVPRMRTR